MKLIHPDYIFQIEFQEGMVQKLVLESPEVLSDFIVDFKKQLEGRAGKWVLSHGGEVLKISDNCDLIINIFELEINQKKMLNVLYDKLAVEIQDTELLMDWRAFHSNLESMLNQAIDGVGYEISYGDLELKALFKVMELKFREETEGYVDYLLEYLQLMSEVRKIRVFIIVNLTSFLTKTELEYLYEQAAYKKYQLLLLEARNISVNAKMERTIVVDKDYCIIDISVR